MQQNKKYANIQTYEVVNEKALLKFSIFLKYDRPFPLSPIMQHIEIMELKRYLMVLFISFTLFDSQVKVT